jgi:hypothetical protein
MVEVYADLFKPVPYVPDQGIDVVVKQTAQWRPLPKEFLSRPEQFRDNSVLEKLVKSGWTISSTNSAVPGSFKVSFQLAVEFIWNSQISFGPLHCPSPFEASLDDGLSPALC